MSALCQNQTLASLRLVGKPPASTCRRLGASGGTSGARPTFGRRSREKLRRFAFGRQPSLRRQLIDKARQCIAQMTEQLVASHAGLLAERVDSIAPECIGEVVWRNLLIVSAADPRLCDTAVSALL